MTSAVIPNKEAKKLSYFSKTLDAVQKVEHATSHYAKNYPTKGKLTMLALGNSSLDHIVTDNTVIEHICLHLILIYFPSTGEVQTLNACIKSFDHFRTILLHKEPKTIYNLF